MALSDAFLSPLGLAALLAAVPVVLLYLVRPDPRRVTLPTVRFLTDADGTSSSRPLLERLKRSALLLLQLLAIVLFATALAAPYVPVSESETVEETVLVVDASASMNVETGGTTRFDRAVAAAREETTSTTSVVVVDGESSIALRAGTAGDAAETLSDLRATDAPGDLRTAIARGSSLAGENARVVVLSDFAGDDDWEAAVQSARARGLTVDLRQFDGGGDDNVGIVDRSFSGEEVTVSVQNSGSEEVTRRVSLGEAEETVSLAPGDVRSVTLPVPAGGGEVRLSPGDSFPTDDVAYVAAPEDAAVDVLLVTNDENRYLTTALSVIDPVELTVVEPPDSIPDPPEETYDVVLYSNVDADEIRDAHVAAGRDALAADGGVGVQADGSMPVDAYGDLLLIAPDGMGSNPTLATPAADELTRDITFPPPERYVRGDLRSGRALVSTNDGTPIVATESRGGGRILYYGYVESGSSFKYDFEYPIFWKRSVYALADRESLSDLNRETGAGLSFGNETTIETPRGEVTASRIDAAAAGFYVADGSRYSASLLDPAESDVSAAPVDSDAGGAPTTREEERTVPGPLTEWVALGIVAVALGEVAFLRRRGDL
ncbi:vWA domain-containing protein [Halobellus limi]|uniref:N-terminal double-transmembrane domain-containing protein n=1 Tax=Halobellus limi TaxID=699433 RepID=A0A1H5ZX72_9EURY|nr:VWA domain-containing protein [Halobellus limi]QCC47922.1 VWA domain-containing protein [Halobellus limi]SEG40277.1 N-terminal double-transmembrane domain-containing protein [Halobellus limi]